VIPVRLNNSVRVENHDLRSYALIDPDIGETELRYVLDAVGSGWVSSRGPYVREFENRFAAYCDARYGVSASNGTAALHLALASLRVGPGDEVIVPALTFIATAAAVAYTGATPVFAESDPNTWCIDPNSVRRLITPHTRAVIPVHLYGHPADMNPILATAEEYQLAVIEDAAEAHGSTYYGRRVGGIGRMAIFSFYGNKTITAGEGGMLVTNDAALAARARLLSNHAMDPEKRYWHEEIGYNYRMSNVQAALALAQFERIEPLIERKREIFRWYKEFLSEIEGLELNPEMPWAGNSYWLTCVVLPRRVCRDAVMAKLEMSAIEVRPFFHPIHRLPAFRGNARKAESLNVAEDLACRGISLPSGARLNKDDVRHISAVLLEAIRDSV
jgi:perosamine synthetase